MLVPADERPGTMGSHDQPAMTPIVDELRAGLCELLPHRGDSRCCVAFSGGLDSTVVLDAFAAARRDFPGLELRALHVNHQLQPMAPQWVLAAQSFCGRLAIPCEVVSVDVDRRSSLGLEAAAREARHATFRRHLRDGEVLVTAHHADDQFETVLLALLRGAGPRGLAAMPALAPFGRGWHWRPLLAVTRADIATYARARGLAWHDDPTNLELRHDRNYLRHEVVPQLQARWPQSAKTATRTARHIGEALELLDAIALDDLKRAAVEECLDVGVLASLPDARRRQLLRFWLLGLGARPPTERRLDAMLNDLLEAAADRCPQIDLEDGLVLRRHRALVYPVRDGGAVPALALRTRLRAGAAVELPDGSGRLALAAVAATEGRGRAPVEVEVRSRCDGERVTVPARSHSRSVKELMRALGVLPWMRDRVPLVFHGGELIALGDVPLPGLPAAQASVADALHFAAAQRWRALR